MKCIYCGSAESKVIDSRSADDDTSIRRRRECGVCGRRFTTYETVEIMSVMVVKTDGTRQPFDSRKMKSGILKATEKCRVSVNQVDELVDDVTKQIYNSMQEEVSSKEIGEMVMERLKKLDEVAYVRYASVYRSFKDVSTFMEELKKLVKDKL